MRPPGPGYGPPPGHGYGGPPMGGFGGYGGPPGYGPQGGYGPPPGGMGGPPPMGKSRIMFYKLELFSVFLLLL